VISDGPENLRFEIWSAPCSLTKRHQPPRPPCLTNCPAHPHNYTRPKHELAPVSDPRRRCFASYTQLGTTVKTISRFFSKTFKNLTSPFEQGCQGRLLPFRIKA
jgi:hypothetical protein